MMANKPTSSKLDAELPAGPTHMARSIISLVLFLHLFCVFVALATNNAPSQLSLQFLRILRPYTQLLNFDLTISYQWTLGAGEDVDHRLEVLPVGKDGNDADAWHSLPDVGLRGSERRARYERLAELMDIFVDQEREDNVALVAADVGTYFLNHERLKPRQIRCRRHTLVSLDAYTTLGTPEMRNPNSPIYFEVVYDANAVVDEDTRRVEVVKIDAVGEVARPTGNQ